MSVGFFIVRNVQTQQSNAYWNECVRCIRQHYAYPLWIIDTGSNPDFLQQTHQEPNVTQVQAPQPNRAMLSAYLFFLRNKPCETAIILQDSIFVKKNFKIPSRVLVQPLWHFQHTWNAPERELSLLQLLEKPEALLELYKSHTWRGCFGSMSLVSLSVLEELEAGFQISRLEGAVKTWEDWLAMERVFGVLFTWKLPELVQKPSLLGDIHSYSVPYGLLWEQYKQKQVSPIAPLIKVFTTRK